METCDNATICHVGLTEGLQGEVDVSGESNRLFERARDREER